MVAVEVGYVFLISGLSLREYGLSSPDFSWLSSGLRFGLPLLPGSVSMLSVHYIDRLVIPRYCPMTSLGVYAFAYAIAQMAVNVSTAPFKRVYGKTAYARYNEGRHGELRSLCQHTLASTLMLATPAVVALFYLGDEIVGALRLPSFARAGDIMWVVALGYLAQALAKTYRVNIAFAVGSMPVLVLLLVTCGTNLGLNLLMIPVFGIAGAAWSTTISLGVAGVLTVWFSNRHFRVPIYWGITARVALAASAMATSMATAEYLLEGSGVHIVMSGVLIGVAGALAYGAVLYRHAWRYAKGAG